ncbi:MAG TPA: response regulator [Pyrinomonadaceae bacterium]|nr:response regulator [Pyrinomonadaceae bacterium]
MINILFVDDEPNILEGLERMLRSVRHEWHMFFVGSGGEALALLDEKDIDVIVSDMKMPGMDGSELLQAVSEKHPNVVRIILSGFSEKEINMRSVGTAHQYLSKPCDPELLKTTVSRVCALRDLLTDKTLRHLVSQLPTIPSLPALYSELVNELGRERATTAKIAEIIRKDIGMTVKILQIVNSAFFGLRRHISDSRSAVEFLGLDTISSLTLGLGVISQFEFQTSSVFFAELWAHSMAVGVVANKIALLEDPEVGNDAFTAGLLHDIGKVILAVNLPEKFKAVEEIVKNGHISMFEAEKRIFGATHTDVGAYLLGLWGLPDQVVQAVAFHHAPRDLPLTGFSALTAVHAANALHPHLTSDTPKESGPELDYEYLGKLGLLERIPVWREKCAAISVETARIQL